jgi:thiol-disulfide isomerase/thioredoxin
MRVVLAAAMAIMASFTTRADDPKSSSPSLKIGDPAPALTVTKWLVGDAVAVFDSGKIYIVEFWSTSCGPLHFFMPMLSDLQARYKDKGVTVISFTSRDIRGIAGNTEADVAAFIKKQRPPVGHTFAYADNGTMAVAWLAAAGQKGFCTFLVDRSGRIAFMGHPMFMEFALSKVLAGRANAKSVGNEMATVMTDYETMHERLVRDFQSGRDLKPGLRALKAFEAKYPPMADLPTLIQAKLSLLPKHGQSGEGKDYATALIAKATEQKDVRVLGQAYSILRDQKENADMLALARKAAEAHVQIDGGQDAQSLLNLGEAYFTSGDKAKAKECANKAIAIAANEPAAIREHVEKEAKRLGIEK